MHGAFSITSDGRTFDPQHQYARPSEAEKQQTAAYREVLRRDPPGYSSDNRWRQVQHLSGIIYVAISRIRNLAAGATYEVLQRKKRKGNRATFGPGGTVAKSLSGPQQQGRDEDYVPLADEDHPLCRMLSRPNPNETFGELAAKLVMQNRLTGVGPLWTIPNERHRPVELWSLKTPLLYPLRQLTREYPNGAWRVTPYAVGSWAALPVGLPTSGATIPGEEVKRWMEPHPYLDWDGYSPLTAGAKQLDVLESIDEARKSAMDKGVVLDTYVVIPGASDTELQAFVDRMAQRHGSSKNHRAFAAFGTQSPESKATFQSANARVVDMDFPEGWEQMTKFCLALFGVPASVAGLNMAGSYSEHYAAWQQFHDEQADYLHSFAVFLTKALAWPWCSFNDEYLVKVTPRPINDQDLAEKKHSRQQQAGTITFDESRAKDNLPPWPDPEIGKLPVPIALQAIGQSIAPQPQPGMDGAMSGAGPEGAPPEGEQPEPTDAAGLQEHITSEALAALGVPAGGDGASEDGAPADPVMKSWLGRIFGGGARGKWDESKHSRNHGKFAPKGSGTQTGETLPRTGGGKPPPLPQQGQQRQPGKPPPLPQRSGQSQGQQQAPSSPVQRIKQSAPKIAILAGRIPGGGDVLANAAQWAHQAADRHADQVSAHLGISREEAHALVRATIEHLCHTARTINKTGRSQKTHRGRSGEKIRFEVSDPSKDMGRGNRGTGGAVPSPKNPMGKGSRPPMAKAMNTLSGSEGGFLVPQQYGGKVKRRKRRTMRMIRKALEQLEG